MCLGFVFSVLYRTNKSSEAFYDNWSNYLKSELFANRSPEIVLPRNEVLFNIGVVITFSKCKHPEAQRTDNIMFLNSLKSLMNILLKPPNE